MSGIGGDCFVVYSPMADTPLAFNGSGRAPAGAECEWYRERNFSEIHEQSPHAVTVPGAIDAWCRLLADHGTKEHEVLTPAIRLAEDGFPVTPRVAYDWAREVARLSLDPDAARQYIPGGHAPGPGDRFRQPELAATLRKISPVRPSMRSRLPRSARSEDCIGRRILPRTLAVTSNQFRLFIAAHLENGRCTRSFPR